MLKVVDGENEKGNLHPKRNHMWIMETLERDRLVMKARELKVQIWTLPSK